MMRTIEGTSELIAENFQNDVFQEKSEGLGLVPHLGTASMPMKRSTLGGWIGTRGNWGNSGTGYLT